MQTKIVMKQLYTLVLICLLTLSGTALKAQCFGGTSAGSLSPTTVFQTVGVSSGQYFSFNATAGNVYVFTFCQGGGSASFDSQMTLLDGTGATGLSYSDDVCGLASEVSWSCGTSGTYRILVNDFYCASSGLGATLAYRMFVPGPGANCGNPHIVPSLPFTATGLSTCGAGNDYSSPQSCASLWMGGEDYVFRYNAPGAQTIRISLSNTASGTVGVFVTQGCPDVGSCIPANTVSSGCGGGGGNPNESYSGNPVAEFTLPAAGTYHFFVDTWPSPACTPFDINVQVVSGGGGGVGCTNYTITTPSYSPNSYTTGTLVSVPSDDYFASGTVPIPFSFCFMGTNYTSAVVSTNAYLSFNPSCVGQYSGWTTAAIPSPANTAHPEAMNSIMFPWADVNPALGGNIRYNTYGTAPNRRLVVAFDAVPMFSCTSTFYTGQVVLYETSHIIDVYVQNYPNCPGWNSGLAVLGLFDASGTAAVPVPGYNNTVFSLANFAQRFTPSCPTCGILPVGFANLSGTYEAARNVISWTTNYELHSANFTLERSRDGVSFETVGTVDGLGSDPVGKTYQMEDFGRYPDQTFYRVVERDVNGSETLSDVIMVSGNTDGISLANLQVKGDQLSLDIYNGMQTQAVHVDLLDAVGKVLVTTPISAENGRTTHNIDISRLSAGVYIATLKTNNGTAVSRKFVRN